MGSSELAWWSLVARVCGNSSIMLVKRLGSDTITDLVFVSASSLLSDRRPHILWLIRLRRVLLRAAMSFPLFGVLERSLSRSDRHG